MDLMELAGPNYRDLPHDETYGRIMARLGGLKAVAPYLPFDPETLAAKYKHDPHFNQTDDASVWDQFSGFKVVRQPGRHPKYEPTGRNLWHLVNRHGVTAMVPAQAVCLLKYTAKALLVQEGLVESDAVA